MAVCDVRFAFCFSAEGHPHPPRTAHRLFFFLRRDVAAGATTGPRASGRGRGAT